MHLTKLFAILMASSCSINRIEPDQRQGCKYSRSKPWSYGAFLSRGDKKSASVFRSNIQPRPERAPFGPGWGPPSPSDQSLPFGFASRENFPNGFLETKTKFSFRNGKLIVDNYALAPQPTGSIPPRFASWPLRDGFPSFHPVVFREMLAFGKASYYVELVEKSELDLSSFFSKFLIHSISTNVNWWILFL